MIDYPAQCRSGVLQGNAGRPGAQGEPGEDGPTGHRVWKNYIIFFMTFKQVQLMWSVFLIF